MSAVGDPVRVGVTDHAEQRWRQRVAGALDARPEIISRVSHAWAARSVSLEPPPGAAAQRGSVYVRDLDDRSLVFVCLWDRPNDELVVLTLWEDGDAPRVPREFTDAVREPPRRRD